LKTKLLTLLIVLAVYIQNVSSQSTVNEHSIKFLNTSVATIVGEDGVILKTTDGGTSWVEQNSGITNVFYGYDHLDNNSSIAAGENGITVKSVDGGNTWSIIASGSLEHLRDVAIVSSTVVLACGDNGTLIRSDDFGENWTSVLSGITENLNDLNFIDANTGLAVGEGGTMLKTEDGGMTWRVINTAETYGDYNAIAVRSALNLIVVGDDGGIFHSSDAGETWYAPIVIMGPIKANDVVFFTEDNGIMVCDNGLILRSMDGGQTWIGVITNTSADFMSVSFSDVNNGICVGENGVEIYTTNGGASWSTRDTSQIGNGSKASLENIISQNYPNPFNPSTTISYQLPNDANVQINVFDITGKQVASLFDGSQRAGNHSVKFDASNLSSGVYFYRLTAISGQSKIVKTNKMLLTK